MISRDGIIEQAQKVINGQRQQDYGKPENNFGTIAKLWNAYLGPTWNFDEPLISENDVAIMMCLLKIARIGSGRHHMDNYVDLIGYAALAGEIASEKHEEAMRIADQLRNKPEDNVGGLTGRDD